MSTSTTQVIEAVEVDPSTLVIGANVRLDTHLDKSLVQSIRERGVLEPIVAYRDEDDRLVVLMGQRRTLSAVQVQRATVPVVVVPRPQEADRLIDQMAENDHRVALTAGERVEAFAQLSMLGMSPAQIAKKAAADRKDVDAALTVAKSRTARSAVEESATLTLAQAAVLTEFEDDEAAIDRLMTAAVRGGFDHEAQRIRDEYAYDAAKAKAVQEYEAQGYAVIEFPSYDDTTTWRVSSLTDAEGTPLTPENHAQCPGRAVALAIDYRAVRGGLNTECTCGEGDCEGGDDGDGCTCPTSENQQEEGPIYAATHLCRDWRNHGHLDRWGREGGRTRAADMSEDERDEAARNRRQVIANNKAADSAQVVRRAWLATFATRKTAPKGGPALTATVLTRWPEWVDEHKTDEVLAALFDIERSQARAHLAGLIEKAGDARATHLALIRTLAAIEATTVRDCWRHTHDIRALYLTTIAGWGYELAPVERLMAGLPDETEGETEDEGHAEDVRAEQGGEDIEQ